MDPEPWRCRRTDGKKWRCSKNVVAQQKYCDGHMHRGCQRSRKPVEAASLNTAAPTNSTPLNLKPTASTANHVAVVGHGKDNDAAITINSRDIDGRGNCVGRKAIGVGDNAIMGKHIGLSFSPNSVLQGCSSNVWYCKSNVEAEPGRCRRTDGKKWRCSRDVIPDHKYCERHMHRGAKKPVTVLASVNSNLSIVASPPPPPPPPLDDKGSTSSSGDTTISDASTNACENGTVVG